MSHTLKQSWNIIRLCMAWVMMVGAVIALSQPGRAEPPNTAASQTNASWDWQIEVVDSLASGNALGLVMDSNDRPHILYPQTAIMPSSNINSPNTTLENSVLQHAWYDGTLWQIEPAITDMSGSFKSLEMKIGTDDSLHAVYQQIEFNTLTYANNKEGAWGTEPVTTTPNSGYTPSLAINLINEPWIVYISDSLGGELIAAHKEAGGWVSETVTTQAQYPALVFDANNRPHISYCALVGQACGSLRHAWYDGATWQTELIANEQVGGTAIAVAPNGSLEVAYYDALNGDLKRAVNTGTSWQTSLLYSDGNSGADPRLTVDSLGNFHVAFQDITNQRLLYTQGNDSGWNTDVVGSSNGLYHELTVGQDDHPALAFWDQTDNQLKYAASVSKPDLALTSAWLDGTTVWAQVRNLSDVAIGLGSQVRIQVDGTTWGTTTLSSDLLPSERRNIPFSGTYTCSGSSDAVAVLVDSNHLYRESNEANNAWSGTWTCDTSAPVITAAPTVSNISANSAVVSWQTNEPSTSLLYWSTDNRTWHPLSKLLLETTHQITISGLQPSSVIVFYVRSDDQSTNSVQSERYRFRTSATPSAPPTPPAFQFNREARSYEAYSLRATFTNANSIERVEFREDGQVLATAFASTDGTFEAEILPAQMSTTRAQFYKEHVVTVQAYMLDGATFSFPYSFTPVIEYMTAEVIFTEPQESIYYINGTIVPQWDNWPLEVSATEYEWSCDWSLSASQSRDSGTPPIDCPSVQSAVQSVQWYVNGHLEATTNSLSESNFNHRIPWSIGGYSPGVYTILAVATAEDGSQHSATRNLEIRQGTAQIAASRSIFRSANTFTVSLTVRNMPSATASISLMRSPTLPQASIVSTL